MRCSVPLEQRALSHASGSYSCIRFPAGSVANSLADCLENKLKRNLNHELSRGPGQQGEDKRVRPRDTVCKPPMARFHCLIARPWTGSKSEERGNYPLHFFWSTFFTSSNGNPLIGKEIDPQQERKRPWEKSQIGRERPALRHTNRA